MAAGNKTSMPRRHNRQADFTIFEDDAHDLTAGNNTTAGRHSRQPSRRHPAGNQFDTAVDIIIRMAGRADTDNLIRQWAARFVGHHWTNGDEHEVLDFTEQPGDTPAQSRRRLRHFRRRMYANEIHYERWSNAEGFLEMPDHHIDIVRQSLVARHSHRDFHDVVRRQTDMDIADAALSRTIQVPRDALLDRGDVQLPDNVFRGWQAEEERIMQEVFDTEVIDETDDVEHDEIPTAAPAARGFRHDMTRTGMFFL